MITSPLDRNKAAIRVEKVIICTIFVLSIYTIALVSRIVVDSSKKSLNLNLGEILAYKDLFLTLTYRDIKVKYAQTFLGVFWAIIQPLAQLVVLTFVFGKVVKVDTGNIPHPLYTLSGMCSWTYFALVLNQAGNSIVGVQDMVKKIYFPRLIIPLSKSIVGLIDYGVTLIFLIVLLIIYGFPPSANIVFVPIFLLLTIVSALGVGIWVSSLSIRYRDFQYVVPFLIQFGLYAMPIAYPANLVPEKLQLLYHFNPMTGIIEGFRWCTVGGEVPGPYAYVSYVIAIVTFITSLIYFKKAEKTIADIL